MSDKKSLDQQQQAIALIGIQNTDGFKLILDLLEAECVESENTLIATPPDNKDLVLAQHAIVFAQRQFCIEVVAKIQRLISSIRNPQPEKDDGLSDILSALPE